MLKNILNLKGAQEMTKNEQKEINGGLKHTCRGGLWCTGDAVCTQGGTVNAICVNQCCELL